MSPRGGARADSPTPAWPAGWVPEGEFAAYLAARQQPGGPSVEVHAQDLYLACACVRGVPDAVEAFEVGYVGQMRRALARLRLGADEVEELVQILRQELLVARPAATPLIASYAGRGSLAAWLRVTATRKGLKALRRTRTSDEEEAEALEAQAPGDDPELTYLRSLYGDAFRAAFLAAMAATPPRDKTLLKQHFIDGLTIDDLAALHHVHRATAARWINKAREDLLDATRREFARQANVSAVECESVLRLLHSRLDVTWRRLLA